MLTDQQLTEAAYRHLADELDFLARCEMNGPVGDTLCRTYCNEHPDDHQHNHAESVREVDTVTAVIRDAVTALRGDLAQHAAAHNITLPDTPRRED
jgi:hypothetical protein